MIVTNNEDGRSIRKSSPERSVEPSAPSSSTPLLTSQSPEPLRDVGLERHSSSGTTGGGYQTFPGPVSRSPATAHGSLPLPVGADNKESTSRARWRFFKALAIAFAIYALLEIMFQVGFFAGRYSKREPRARDDPWDGGRGWPLPPNGRYEHQTCARYEGNSTEFALETSIPPDADGLFFVTRGDHSVGEVHFKYDASLRGDFASLVEAHELDSDQQKLLARTSICLLKTGNTYGVGISTPTKRWGKKTLVFTVTFSLPYTAFKSSESARRLGSIKSDAPNYHHVLDIPRNLYFVEEVDINTTNRPIKLGSISGASISVQTTNAHIEGLVCVNGTLKIRSSNGFVGTNIIAQNDPASSEPTKINLSTGNNQILGILLLQSTANDRRGGEFEVSAQSTNDRVDLKAFQIPLLSTLNLAARTTNSPVTVLLAPEFEGAFDLSTSNSPVRVTTSNSSDPEDRGRERNVKLDAPTSRRANGSVSWSKDFSTGDGTVVLQSTNAPVMLHL